MPDDNFHVLASSPVIDRGSPLDPYLGELSPNGNRVDVGAYGNTSGATNSAAQQVQITTPEPLQKIQIGQQVPINWQSSGLTVQRPVSLINAGGGAVDYWNAEPKYSNSSVVSFSTPVNTTAIANPAPAAVYQSYTQATTAAVPLSYQLAVPDGTYEVRLHFVEPAFNPFVGMRKFDIQLQGTTVQAGFDIFATAGAAFKAIEKTYSLTASGGAGIALQLNSSGNFSLPIISAIEVLAADSFGVAAPTFNLDQSSDNGLTWSPLATNQTADRFGRGAFLWTVPASLPRGAQNLIRVTSNDGIHAQNVSTRPFLVTNNGHDYYVNDAAQTGDIFTTNVGNNLNNGKSPDQPMANLAALLTAYDLGPGDVVHVDSGNYDMLRNIVITAEDSGLTITGPNSGTTLIRRGVTGSFTPRIGSVFELQHATGVTLDHLSLTNAFAGVYAADDSASTGLTVSNSTIFGTQVYGIYLGRGADFATVAFNTVYGLPGGSPADDQIFGINIIGNDTQILGNQVFDNIIGIVNGFSSLRGLIRDNEIYGNRYGIQDNAGTSSITAGASLITTNVVRDNSFRGISSGSQGASRIIDNIVRGQSAVGAIGIESNNEVAGNTVYGNYDGISGTGIAIIHNNRVFNNANVGINGGSQILANRVYSNSIGIQYASQFFSATFIVDNIVYANTNAGILLSAGASRVLDVVHNTVYQSVGDAVRVVGNGQNTRLRDNILWVESGYDLNVAASAQAALTSDYNLLYKGTDPNAHIGFWNSVNQDSLLAWQTTSGRDGHSIAAQPQFVDINGADNVFGYKPVNSVLVDGGADDNFYLRSGSPGIDSGYSWSYAVDAEGFVRRDDVATGNQGSPEYFPIALGASQFAAVGTPLFLSLGLNSVSLPFSFPFYDATYPQVLVSRQGYVQLGFDFTGVAADSVRQFGLSRRIAPLSDASLVYRTGDGIFVDTTSVAGQVTVRWKATNPADESPVNFAAVLFSDGRIRFDYGAGNAGLNPVAGISFGDNHASQLLSGYNGSDNLANANSVMFTLAAGYTDMGAYEFRGSSFDATPPSILSTLPTAVGANGDTGGKINSIELLLSEDINAIDASASAVYELRKSGSNGFGSADDVVYSLTPQYTIGTTNATLKINGLNGAGLPVGQYRLTVTSNLNTSIHDLAGLRLDGDTDGGEGGNYVRIFSVIPAMAGTPVVTNAATFANVQTKSGLLISRNAADSIEVTHFKITSITGGSLFQNDGTTAIHNGDFITFAEANAGLKFTPTLDSTVTGHFTVQASLSNLDSGLGGSTVTANITVTLPAPVITGPNAVTLDQRPAITWNTVSGAVQYIVNIRNLTAGANSSALWVVNGNSWTPTTDLGIGRFDATVRAISASGTSSFYAPRSIFQISTPAVFTNVQRFQGSATPSLSWMPLRGAVKFDLWINNMSTGQQQVVRDLSVKGTSWTSPTDLPMGSYRAWIRGTDASGKNANWSKFTDFFVLPPVTLVNPVNPTFDLTPTFTWNAVPGAVSYDLYYRNLSTGAATVAQTRILETSYTPSGNLPTGSYRWYVLAVIQGGYRSQSATVKIFFVGGRPTVLTPNGDTPDTTPTLTWTPVTDAATYQLWVDRIDVSTNQIIYQTGLASASFTPTTSLPVGKYRVWVRAVSATSQLSLWSQSIDFTIVAMIDEPVTAPGDLLLTQLTLLDNAVLQKVDRTSSDKPDSAVVSHEACVIPDEATALRLESATEPRQQFNVSLHGDTEVSRFSVFVALIESDVDAFMADANSLMLLLEI